MNPRKWRKEVLEVTLDVLSLMMKGAVSVSYISRVERMKQEPSGKILKLYEELSNGKVLPSDFKKEKK